MAGAAWDAVLGAGAGSCGGGVWETQQGGVGIAEKDDVVGEGELLRLVELLPRLVALCETSASTRGGKDGGAEACSGGDAEGSGVLGVRGVSVQVGAGVGAEVARVLMPGEEEEEQQGQEQPPCHVQQQDGRQGSSRECVRLLRMEPPALGALPYGTEHLPYDSAQPGTQSGPQGGASPPSLRLLLDSPRPQAVRVLVMDERCGAEAAQSEAAAGVCAAAGAARVLQEGVVWVSAGVQEVEVMLGKEVATAAAATQGGASATGGGVGVMQVVLLPPVLPHAEEEEAAAVAAVLVHALAPPLLVLPAAAAEEVCRLWVNMQAAWAEQQQQQQERGLRGAVSEGALLLADSVGEVYWRHLAPLLNDMAFAVMTAAARAGSWEEEGAGGAAEARDAGGGMGLHRDSVKQVLLESLLPYLYGNGMTATAGVLLGAAGEHLATPTAGGSWGAGGETRAEEGLLAATGTMSAAATVPVGYSYVARLLSTATRAVSWLCSVICTAVLRLVDAPHRLPPLAPFQPPALERRFQAWRTAGLARTAPYLLAILAQPYLMGVLRTAREQSALVLVQTVVVCCCIYLSDVLGYAVLFCHLYGKRYWMTKRPYQDKQQPTEEARRVSGAAGYHGEQQQHCGKVGSRAFTAGLPYEAAASYQAASTLYGPVLLIFGAIVTRLYPLPSNDAFVNNPKALIGSVVHRTVLMPCVQQLSARDAAVAAPVLAVGEAIQLAALQPDRSWMWLAAMVGAWRLGAVVVSGVWEWRARRKFAWVVRKEQERREGKGQLGCGEVNGMGGGNKAVKLE